MDEVILIIGFYGETSKVIPSLSWLLCREKQTSRKHLRTKVTPDLHLTYSKNGGNLGSESK